MMAQGPGLSKKMVKLRHQTDVKSLSFSITVIEPWNSLPEKVVSAPLTIIVGRGQWPVALGVLTVTVVAGVQAGCPADVAPSGRLPRGFLQDLLWCVLPGAVLQWRGKAGQQHE
ncbi:hypothetical protein E2C01_097733 [Portunus trituberculatus]|uniref:Uncharacterized protein n=1 Tax=Portunus trituberculatus TaxID=210409 RepID=A0A5B7JZF1_PORTR|nr:hypothetical protein [Portunus trituberculatus]